MNVLYVTGMYPTPVFPQKGIFCHEQVKALKADGIHVDVLVPYPFYSKKQISCQEWEYEGITIKYFPFFKLPGTYDFHFAGQSLLRSLKKYVDLRSYDVYHADAPLPIGQAIMLASRNYGIPYVVYGHGLDVYLDVNYHDRNNIEKIVNAAKEVYTQANAIIGVSQKVINNIVERLDVSQKCHVVYNGVDPNLFYPQTTDHPNFTICTIGNLIPLKGHEDTIHAVSKVYNEKAKNIRLNIIGRGPLESSLRKLVHDLKLDEIVTFAGYIPYENVVKELQKSDIFVLPSWYEALGCVYLEAMATGLPVIGCKNNGIDEIILDGINGFLVDEQRSDQIAILIEKLLDKSLRNRIGSNARDTILSGYTWSDSARSLIKIYEQIQGEKVENSTVYR